MNDVIAKAKEFAIKAHGDQKYGKHPYSYHLQQVADLVEEIVREEYNPYYANNLVCAAWLHDVVEDTKVTVKQIEKEFGPTVARMVTFLSTPIEDNYLSEDTEGEVILKACDRLCNIKESFGNKYFTERYIKSTPHI